MKKLQIILVMVAMCATTLIAQAQDSDVKFGIKGGINLANLYSGDDVNDDNLKVGLNAGLFVKLPIVPEVISIQPEVLYSSQGSKITYDNFVLGEGEYRFNLNYIQVPVLAVVNFGEFFNIHAGPYASYLASVDIKDVDDDGTINEIADLDADNFERFDYGVTAGIAFEGTGFTIGARYALGFNEVGDSGISGQLTDNQKNSFGTVYVGITF